MARVKDYGKVDETIFSEFSFSSLYLGKGIDKGRRISNVPFPGTVCPLHIGLCVNRWFCHLACRTCPQSRHLPAEAVAMPKKPAFTLAYTFCRPPTSSHSQIPKSLLHQACWHKRQWATPGCASAFPSSSFFFLLFF